MNIKEIHNKLDKQCPSGYKINEIISFAYPFRRIKIKATVNKSPEKSIQQVYSVFLRSINAGYNTENEIIDFLGLHKEDFILRELYFLRERGFTDLVSGHWIVTEQGNDFIKDNSILKILEEEDFEFLIDAISNKIIAKEFKTYQINKDKNRLISQIPQLSNRDAKLLEGKNEEISDIYRQQYKGKAYLVDYDKNNIIFDSENKEFNEYYLIEYIPRIEKQNELEPFIEVRNKDKDISKEKRISNILAKQYPSVIYQLTNSERNALESILESDDYEDRQIIQEFERTEKPKEETKTLSIWETQAKFEEALKTVKYKILIESPWIKKATLNYIELIEKALKRKVTFYILYGIEGNDEHHYKTMERLKELQSKYKNKFNLIHLPTHFEEQQNYQMTGTHRKLVIKDEDYYIQGSFNFLSFNKKEGQKVANEESLLIAKNIKDKWDKVFKEYNLHRDDFQ